MQANTRTLSFFKGSRTSVLALAASGLLLSGGGSAHAQTYIGNAYDAGANVGIGLNILNIAGLSVDTAAAVGYTGALPSSGGNINDTLLGVNADVVYGVATPVVTVTGNPQANTQVASSSTVGASDHVTSTATIANVNLLSGLVTATAVQSQTTAAYSSSTSTALAGTTTITGLTFDGSSVTVTGAPNQTVEVYTGVGPLESLAAELIINEQIFSDGGTVQTTNALDLQVYNGLLDTAGVNGKVVVASSTAGFTGGGLSAAPEPGAVALLVSALPGLAGAVAMRRRRMASK